MKKLKSLRVALVFSSFSSFVRKDLIALSKFAQVISCHSNAGFRLWKKKGFADVLRIFMCVLHSDVVFCWFAGVPSLYAVVFAKLLRKKSVVVVGGVDASCEPSIGYGHFSKRSSRLVDIFVYKLTDLILPVANVLSKNLVSYVGPELKKKIVVLSTGYDANHWKPKGEKENMVLTVGAVTAQNLKRKGFIHFVRVSSFMRNVKFVVVGKISDTLKRNLRLFFPNDNLIFAGFVSDSELLGYYQKAKVYCQLSWFEGLPNALCEAMLCGCIPVGTSRCGGIVDAMGFSGSYVEYGDVESIRRGVELCLADQDSSRLVRDRIMSKFSLEKREIALKNIICGVVK